MYCSRLTHGREGEEEEEEEGEDSDRGRERQGRVVESAVVIECEAGEREWFCESEAVRAPHPGVCRGVLGLLGLLALPWGLWVGIPTS